MESDRSERNERDYGQMVHKPVMLKQVIEALNIKPDGIYVDATLGGAGHSSEILSRLGRGGLLIGIDQDEMALATAVKRLSHVKTEGEFKTAKSNFVNLKKVCDSFGIDKVDGILMDLGVSSFQLDSEERGFSYRFDSPIDMRMDLQGELTGADVVNDYPQEKLREMIYAYSDEKFASQISREIVRAREQKRIETTGELVRIIEKAIPQKARLAEKGHPAKRTFQAIRIEVNKELEVLEKGLGEAIDILSSGGRLCVLTFESLETRICRKVFREKEDPCTCPKNFPVCVCGKKPLGKMLGRGIFPDEEEIAENPRSSCASLRIFEKY